jgi:hypothetical protein
MKQDLGNTGFLLVIGALPLACTADPGEGNAETVPTTSPSDEEGGTTDDGPDTADDGPDTADDAPTTVETTDPDGGGTTGGVPEVCETYAQHYAECFPDNDVGLVEQYCATYFGYAEYYGAACIGAMEDVYACLSALDCAALQSEDTPICEAEYDAVTKACPWEDDTTGGSGSESESDGSEGESSSGG